MTQLPGYVSEGLPSIDTLTAVLDIAAELSSDKMEPSDYIAIRMKDGKVQWVLVDWDRSEVIFSDEEEG